MMVFLMLGIEESLVCILFVNVVCFCGVLYLVVGSVVCRVSRFFGLKFVGVCVRLWKFCVICSLLSSRVMV